MRSKREHNSGDVGKMMIRMHILQSEGGGPSHSTEARVRLCKQLLSLCTEWSLLKSQSMIIIETKALESELTPTADFMKSLI